MGLVIEKDLLEQIKGKTLVDYNFTYGNTEVIYMLDSEGNETSLRIPTALRDLLLDFSLIEDYKTGKKAA
jgi:hypothetical protein